MNKYKKYDKHRRKGLIWACGAHRHDEGHHLGRSLRCLCIARRCVSDMQCIARFYVWFMSGFVILGTCRCTWVRRCRSGPCSWTEVAYTKQFLSWKNVLCSGTLLKQQARTRGSIPLFQISSRTGCAPSREAWRSKSRKHRHPRKRQHDNHPSLLSADAGC